MSSPRLSPNRPKTISKFLPGGESVAIKIINRSQRTDLVYQSESSIQMKRWMWQIFPAEFTWIQDQCRAIRFCKKLMAFKNRGGLNPRIFFQDAIYRGPVYEWQKISKSFLKMTSIRADFSFLKRLPFFAWVWSQAGIQYLALLIISPSRSESFTWPSFDHGVHIIRFADHNGVKEMALQ